MSGPAHRLAYRVEDAAAMIGVGKSKIWELIQEGRLSARKIDGSTIILHADLEAFVVATPLSQRRKGDPQG